MQGSHSGRVSKITCVDEVGKTDQIYLFVCHESRLGEKTATWDRKHWDRCTCTPSSIHCPPEMLDKQGCSILSIKDTCLPLREPVETEFMSQIWSVTHGREPSHTHTHDPPPCHHTPVPAVYLLLSSFYYFLLSH